LVYHHAVAVSTCFCVKRLFWKKTSGRAASAANRRRRLLSGRRKNAQKSPET
jgi:hypothetical protein